MAVSIASVTPEAFAEATWDEIALYYEELATCPLDESNVEEWLQIWSNLESALREAASLANIAYTTDTGNAAKEAANLRFTSEIGPKTGEQQVRLARLLLGGPLGSIGHERDDLVTTLQRMRNQRDLFREENVPLMQQEAKLNSEYNRITGGLTVDWEGEELPLPRLRPFLLNQDRAVRERAFRLQCAPYIERHDTLADLFNRMYAVRVEIARNAGFANYRDYTHRAKNRFDYTPADCERFHDAVERTVVPAVARIRERRRAAMGLDTLRPWDLAVDPEGRPALAPFADVSTLIDGGRAIFNRLDPALGRYFGLMADEGLLDLDSRKGKRPGGYCTSLPYRGRPFIFMNAAGVQGDVETLMHESGHAFHNFEARAQPYIFQRHPGSEMAEVASMSMELLTAPYLAAEHGGYYTDADARRARIEHFEGRLLESLPHIAAIDAFQHWLYTSGEGHDAAARDAAWLRIHARFDTGLDWRGLEAERLSRWYRQLHVFLYPFYYIEYGIAQIGALQVWRNSLSDQASALAAYRRALALGGTKPLPELFAVAGAMLAFDAETMGALVTLIEEQIAALEKQRAASSE
jgi:oligoendopeptidase F